MTSISPRPLLFLDADGPLNPYAAKPERRPKGYQTYRMRPEAWIDDEITDADRTWVAEHHPVSALLHYVDPCLGLTDTDFTALHDWLRSLPPSSQ